MNSVEPNEHYGHPSRRTVRGPIIAVSTDDTRDDEMGYSHADATDYKNGFPAKAVDEEDCRDRGEEHDDADDAGGEERGGVAAKAEAVEDEGGVVEDCVDLGRRGQRRRKEEQNGLPGREAYAVPLLEDLCG